MIIESTEDRHPKRSLATYISSKIENHFMLQNNGSDSDNDSRIRNIFENQLLFLQRLLTNHMSQENLLFLNSLEDDPRIYNPVKYFDNVMIINGVKIGFNYHDFKTGLNLEEEKKYLMIHVESSDGGFHGGDTLRVINRSMEKLAIFLKTNKERLQRGPLIGITSARIAELSKKFGFTVVETPLPKHIEECNMNRIIEHSPGILRKDPRISLCFQSYDDIIRKFSKV